MFNVREFKKGDKIYHVGRNEFGTFVECNPFDFSLVKVNFNGKEIDVKRKLIRDENKKFVLGNYLTENTKTKQAIFLLEHNGFKQIYKETFQREIGENMTEYFYFKDGIIFSFFTWDCDNNEFAQDYEIKLELNRELFHDFRRSRLYSSIGGGNENVFHVSLHLPRNVFDFFKHYQEYISKEWQERPSLLFRKVSEIPFNEYDKRKAVEKEELSKLPKEVLKAIKLN